MVLSDSINIVERDRRSYMGGKVGVESPGSTTPPKRKSAT